MSFDPLEPSDAQQIVVEYARRLERDISENRHPARADSLPFTITTIKTAIETCVATLGRAGRLSPELREYLETAYVSLADYLDTELVALVTEYRESADHLEAVAPAPQQRMTEPVWRRVAETSALVGEIARSIATESAKLRSDFHQLVSASRYSTS